MEENDISIGRVVIYFHGGRQLWLTAYEGRFFLPVPRHSHFSPAKAQDIEELHVVTQGVDFAKATMRDKIAKRFDAWTT